MTITAAPSSDLQLLAEHRAGDREAFTQLVHRHVDMVYSAALRQVRDPHLADDVTQAVFLLLWQKAASLNDSIILPAWLHRATRYCAANALRLRTIRQRHEERAAQMSPHEIESDARSGLEDAELASVLDRAVARLPATDRAAVIMRYFEGKSADDVATALRITPDAARKRIERALAKLQSILSHLGVTTATPALATFLGRQCIVHSPAHMAASISQTIAAAATGSTAAGAAGAIAKGALVAMTAKTKIASAAAIALLLLGGAAGTYVVMNQNATATTAPTTAPAAAQNVIKIHAYIDGRSRLAIRSNTARWLNLEYNVPGVHGTTSRPTIINRSMWFPTWTKDPAGTGSLSDEFTHVTPPLPLTPMTATVKPITARGQISIIQQPTADNQYTLIVEFDDSVAAGAADYVAEISFTPIAASTQPASTSPAVQ